jgi:hypothetical protein
MSAAMDRIAHLLGDIDTDETQEVARQALDLLGITQIVQLVMELDDTTKAEIFEALADEADAK